MAIGSQFRPSSFSSRVLVMLVRTGLRSPLTLPGRRRRRRPLLPMPNGAITRPCSSCPHGAFGSQPGIGSGTVVWRTPSL